MNSWRDNPAGWAFRISYPAPYELPWWNGFPSDRGSWVRLTPFLPVRLTTALVFFPGLEARRFAVALVFLDTDFLLNSAPLIGWLVDALGAIDPPICSPNFEDNPTMSDSESQAAWLTATMTYTSFSSGKFGVKCSEKWLAGIS